MSMPSLNEIRERIARIAIAGMIGMTLGMWIFAALAILATLVMSLVTQSWAQAQFFIMSFAIIQGVQGAVSGAVIGSVVGAIKRPVLGTIVGELGGFLAYWIIFDHDVPTAPWILVTVAAGILLTGIVLIRIMELLSPTDTRKQVPQATRNIGIGCLIVIALPLALFLLHGVFVVGESYINQAKWQWRGYSNYTISARLIALQGVGGEVRVENGKVVGVQRLDLAQSFPMDYYYVITVDGMYNYIRSWAFKPFSWVTASYDPNYGYPKHVTTNCIMLECERGIEVDSLQFER